MAGWTLKLRWLGRTFTWTGVKASLTESWDLYAESPSPRSVSFTDLAFPPDVNAATLVMGGHRLVGAAATLELDGVVHLAGQISTPRFSERFLAFTLKEEWHEDGGSLPGKFLATLEESSNQLAADNLSEVQDTLQYLTRYFPQLSGLEDSLPPFPNVDLKSKNLVYPVVFGRPGFRGASVTSAPATLAPLVDNGVGTEKVLIAGHPCDFSGSPLVRIYGLNTAGAPASEARTATHELDANGRSVTVVSITGATTIDESQSTEYYAGWSHLATGLPNGAGDVLMYVLRPSTVRIDYAKLASVVGYLNTYKLDGYINEVVTPIKWIADQLLPILPIYPVMGRDGLYFAVWDPDTEPVDRITAGPEAVFSHDLQYSDVEIVNDYTLNYGYRADTDDYELAAVGDHLNSAYAAVSLQVYGLRSEVFDADMVNDPETAARIALDKVRMRGFQPLLLDASLSRDLYDHRRPGDLVELTVPALGMTSNLAWIQAMTRDGSSRIAVTFAVVDDLAR